MIERLAADAIKDDYFNSLYNKAVRILSKNVFLEKDKDLLTDKELKDLLQFSDILSNSKISSTRNKAYELITLLNQEYRDNPFYQTISHSVLAKLGNFPGIDLLNKENNSSELPFDRNLEKKLKEFIQAVPDTENLVFTDSQYELFKRITNAKQFSFSGPTSMGKSFIIKSFIRKIISNKPPENIAIMVPTRALINQFSIDLNKELKTSLEHYNYTVMTNSNIIELPSSGKNFIFVLTPERMLSLLSQKNKPLLNYLFVDEAHKLAAEKDSRAITAYSAISRALRENPNLNIYFSSPNVSNPEIFLKLFKKNEGFFYSTTEAPVSQNLFFIDFTIRSITHYTSNHSYNFESDLIKNSESIYDILLAVGENESNIAYCSSRADAVIKAGKYYEKAPDEKEKISLNVKKTIRQIKSYIHKDYYLCDYLARGIAYHFGNLPQIIRNKVETLFKEKEINFVFCTSTLLEGVNLPAKNIFILNNKNGRSLFSPIDFWNLAGRAGRLRHELSGNIICIKENENDWKKHASLIAERKEIILYPSIENYIDKKLKIIETILNGSPNLKEPENIKEILKYIANIICIDTLEIQRSNYKCEVIEKLIKDNKEEIIELARQKNGNIEVPSTVLNTNYSIKIQIQNRIFLKLKEDNNNNIDIKLPSKVTYQVCKDWLTNLYNLFDWKNEEKDIKSLTQLNYYALLMNQWINGTPLNKIINESINYNLEHNLQVHTGYSNGGLLYEIFNGSKAHVNILIGNVIEDIESVLRFMFEKYFNSYYSIVASILGEENSGSNWATFLEYGSQNPIVIALQNIGLSRHSSDYLYKNFKNCLKIENDKLIEINVIKLKNSLNQDDIEYEEISSILF